MMDSFETSFVRLDDKIDIEASTAKSGGLQTCTFADIFLNSYELSITEQFICPGIIINQESAKIKGRATDNTPLFEHEALHKLNNIHIDNGHIFATDAIGKVYVFTTGHAWPLVASVTRPPTGVCYIPRTKSLMYWTSLTLHVYDCDKQEDRVLKNRHARITAVDCTTSVAVSGDSHGKLCIWFISSWECHHTVAVGDGSIRDIIIQEGHVFVLSESSLKRYNVSTAASEGFLRIKAKRMISLAGGLLLSDNRHLALVYRMRVVLCIPHVHEKLISAEEGYRFFTHASGRIMECEWPSRQWPLELLEFLEAPSFSFTTHWPKHSCLDILAASADLWIPRLTHQDFPQAWFRHVDLRNAIWDVIVTKDIDMSSKWNFLTPHIMAKWYDKNIEVLRTLTAPGDYNATAAMILHRIYKYVVITNTDLQQWCWDHHGRIALRHVNAHFMSDADNLALWRYISKKTITDASAHILTTSVVKTGLKLGFVSIFIRMLLKSNEHCAPTHHMKMAFKRVVSYIYNNLNVSDMYKPLKETGRWKTLNVTPGHVGSYIRHRNLTGYITEIKFQPVQIKWMPGSLQVDLEIARGEHVDVWEYYHKDTPNTLLECALVLFHKEKWQTDVRIRKWKWFETELGAFHNENISVRVFDEPLRIARAVHDKISKIHLSSGMVIENTENIALTSVTPLWSYYEEQMCHIIPMKLQICNQLVKGKIYPLSIKYAKELLSVVQYNVIDKEHRHKVPCRVTAVKSFMDSFFVAMDTGEILEYESIASAVPNRHFIKHTTPVSSMVVAESRMTSACSQEMNVWCLFSGTLLFGHLTCTKISGCIAAQDYFVWLLEDVGDNISLTLWDTIQEIETEHHILKSKGEIFTTDTPAVVSGKCMYCLTKEKHQYDIDIVGEITCVAETFEGICGGTSRGVFFVVDMQSHEIVQWSSSEDHPITTVCTMDEQPYAITGTELGELIVWKIEDRDTHIVHISKIANCKIEHIVFNNMFAAVIFRQNVQVLSVVHARAVLAAHVMTVIMKWSPKWKDRLLQETSTVVKPIIEACIVQNRAMSDAMELLDLCTVDYHHRLAFCQQEFIDILLEAPIDLSRHIVKRLLCFRGPKLDCAICQESRDAEISYLQSCNHRFHTDCLREMVRRRPDYHHELQREYALHYNLMCPTCRKPFSEEDIKTDHFLNQHLQRQ